MAKLNGEGSGRDWEYSSRGARRYFVENCFPNCGYGMPERCHNDCDRNRKRIAALDAVIREDRRQ